MGSKYDHLNQEQLIRLLETRDRRARFGLVWEADEIERDQALNSDFVALDLDAELSCPKDAAAWRNLIIEGDNFDALRHLRMAFAGQVKCIYIDPPYNTGNRDFVYNDRFVDKEDSWRHSKWCEFMFQRLMLARDLLRQDGVIFVHIGEEEVHRLGCLMDKVFPARKVGTFVWRTRHGANDSKEYFRSVDHEYILCYANSDFAFGGHAKELKDYSNPDGDSRGEWVSADLSKAHNYRLRKGTYYAIQNPETGIWYPSNPERVWAYSSGARGKKTDGELSKHFRHHLPEAANEKVPGETMADLMRSNRILWPEEPAPAFYATMGELTAAIEAGKAPVHLRKGLPDLEFWVGVPIGINTPRRKKFKSELRKLDQPLSTWIVPSAEKEEVAELIEQQSESTYLQTKGTAEGTSLLKRMLGEVDFPFPKPLPLVQAILEQCSEGDDLVLDFFGGSCTTAHSVLALNESDGGNRRFIIVSNTEATSDEPNKNICRDVGRLRVERAISGYDYTTKSGPKSVPGLGGDFAYLRTRRIPAGRVLEIDHAQVWTALQLMHRATLTPFKEGEFCWAGDEDEAVMYLPRFCREDAPLLRKQVKCSAAVALYSWQPRAVAQHLRATHVTHLPVAETLARRFGLSQGGKP